MNTTAFSGEWNELKGKVKQRWAKLTDDDMGMIKGNIDELIGRVQKAYGYTKERAWSEFDEFKKSLLDSTTTESPSDPHV